MRTIRSFFITSLGLVLGAPALHAQVDARMLRNPDVSATHITFVYGGDIWVMPKTGGTAQRLTTPRGHESFPRFSPDGASIAFTGNYDGNDDVYVIPTMGGTPERITHHPAADRLVDWYPDGRNLLISSFMQSEKDRFNKLYRTGARGGLPEQLPMPYGEMGAIAPDGKSIVYTPSTVDFRTWKRYRGGWTQDLWLYDLQGNSARKIVPDPANETAPMWHGSTLYFLSDRGGNQRNNIWALDTRSNQVRQVTSFNDYDVRFPAIGPSDIVFENGDRLYILDLASGRHREVAVQVVTDLASIKPHPTRVGTTLQNPGISPTGKRAVFEARGEVMTVPAEFGPPQNLTQRPGSAERSPAWSPDGRWIAYWSDRTGEYELTLRNADASGEERTVTKLGPGFRYRIYWSPDAKSVVFIDQAMKIHLVDVATGSDRVIDNANQYTHGGLQGFQVSWSPDSRWIAFDRDLEDGRRRAVFLYDTRNQRLHQVTSGFYNAFTPTFDPEGKYLFMLTSRSFTPFYSDFDNSWVYNNSTQIAAIPLRNNLPSLLAPRSDDEPVREPPKPAATPATPAAAGSGAASAAAAPAPVEIDLQDFERRLETLPPRPGNYGELAVVAGKVLYHKHVRTGATDERVPVMYYDLKERKEETVLDNAQTFVVSVDGKKMLAVQGTQYAIIDIKPGGKMDKPLATANLEVTVDPRAEWKQIFNDSWRFQRDYFYDPGMHGVDWAAMRERYGSLLDDAVSREDLSFVLGELIGELNASHTYRSGGDLEQPQRRGVGLLGVDYTLENGAFRIQRIIDGAAWDSEMRSPLRRPGVNVKEGDYLLAVNGVALDIAKDPWAAFQGLASATVQLTVNDKPTMTGARTILVETLADEYRLRNLAWIEGMRQKVDKATNGRVGYIYVPSTGVDGQTELERQFMGQFNKDGLIIDERFNSGGQIPDRFVELLNRPVTNFWAIRDGKDWQWPPSAHTGPKAMLVNEWSGSGGDAFPYYFKAAGLGPLIGKRTWGGLIGISGAPPLVDGGSVTVPTFAFYSTDGKWAVEGHGVEPDIEVEQDPAVMARGGDPQLERAIQEVMKQMQTRPPIRAKRPPYDKRIPVKVSTDGTR